MPGNVGVHVDHPGQDGELSKVVTRRSTAAGIDGRDFGSLHDDRGVPQHLSRAVDHRRRPNAGGRLLRTDRGRREDYDEQQSVESHGAL